MANELIPLKKRLVTYRKITIMKSGMNLSSLFSIRRLSITLNFFKTRSDIIGKTKVVTKTMARQMSAFTNETLHIPEKMNTKNIQVGNKTG